MRLIDADALKEEIGSWGMNDYEPSDFIDAIDEAPTVELLLARGSSRCEIIIPLTRSVGKWIFHKDHNESCRYGCDRCGNLNNIPGNFCPNCGAYMKKRSLGDLWLKGGEE